MKAIYKVCLLIISLSLMGCEKEALNVKVPKVEPKLVVQSFISPQDTLIIVNVTKSSPIFERVYKPRENHLYDDNFYDIKDADVDISDGEESIKLTYTAINDFDSAYVGDPKYFPILEGKTYYLTVGTPDGNQVQATCTVPVGVPTIRYFTLDSIQKNHYFDYYSTLGLQDIPGQPNFYAIKGEVWHNRNDSSAGIYPIDFPTNPILSDQGKDGEIIPIKISMSNGLGEDDSYSYYYSLILNVMHTDQHYFNYNTSVLQAENSNPFSEPVFIHSNIEGGLGVFSAFNSTIVKHDFK